MLTADLVRAHRRHGELRVVPLDGRMRARAEELAELFLELVADHVGRTRGELDEALAQVEVSPGERRLADGLSKLIEDRCRFDAATGADPETLRRALFLRATEARRSLAPDRALDRAALLDEVAAAHGLAAADLERLLYADLRAAQVLQSVDAIAPTALVASYDLAQAQAVLLRAVKVVVEVRCASPGGYRALFRKLKFLRLLHTIRSAEKGYCIEIDGPMSLFDAVTRYGLQLALLVPALAGCDHWRLEAELRWGKDRQPLRFHLDGGGDDQASSLEPRLSDEVAALVEGFRALGTEWELVQEPAILELPGIGLCVPDLTFVHRATGECIHFEVLGYWSRQAVWRRVELVERGLPQKILFAVSERLRVSEEALDGELPGMLYVYKGTMSARAIAERLDRLAARR
jgi:uncharacterized protein